MLRSAFLDFILPRAFELGRRKAAQTPPHETNKPVKGDNPSYKVLAQYHSGGERVYEVGNAQAKLEIRISSQSVGPGERTWHVAALEGGAPTAVAITDHAETKQSALAKVATLWSEQEGELGLPSFDWTAVAAALLAVRGI